MFFSICVLCMVVVSLFLWVRLLLCVDKLSLFRILNGGIKMLLCWWWIMCVRRWVVILVWRLFLEGWLRSYWWLRFLCGIWMRLFVNVISIYVMCWRFGRILLILRGGWILNLVRLISGIIILWRSVIIGSSSFSVFRFLLIFLLRRFKILRLRLRCISVRIVVWVVLLISKRMMLFVLLIVWLVLRSSVMMFLRFLFFSRRLLRSLSVSVRGIVRSC